jgi:hypothetical protein
MPSPRLMPMHRPRYDEVVMAAKRQKSTRRTVPGHPSIEIDESWRSRIHKPAETDPKKRAEIVRRAGTRIKTTARIDTITLGRD